MNEKEYISEYNSIINTFTKINIKKELLLNLILKIDEETNPNIKKFRKEFIVIIQNVLNILDHCL